MKKISQLFALSVSTAVLCGIWSYLAGITGLPGWAGFAGCTTYFASGNHGLSGLKSTIFPNMAGVLCGLGIIALSSLWPALGNWGVWCAVITFVMCIISRFGLFAFCPGTFMGCFSTFAANGDWKLLVPSLLIGAILGLGCDMGGKWLYTLASRNPEKSGI